MLAYITGTMLVLVSGTALCEGFDLAPEAERTDALLVREFDGTPLDLNNDGNVDLVVGNVAPGISRIYFGNGDGTFTENAELSSGLTTRDLDAGDINGDGFLDIVQANRDELNNYFLGDGSGNFGAAAAIGAETDSSVSIELADMDDDGLLDVVVANSNDQVNRVYLNTTASPGPGATPSFGMSVDITADADFTRHISVGDLDGDSDLDVVAGNDDRMGCAVCGDAPNKYYLNTLAGGTFGFATGVALAQAGESVDDLELADLDDDGDLDLVKVTFTTVNRFFLNQLIETGTFAFDTGTDISADADHSNAVTVIDVDGDGDLDVMVGNGDTAAMPPVGEPNRLYLNQFVESGNMTVSFDAGQDITTDAFITRDIVSIDLDGIPGPDVITGERDAPNRVYLSNGTATPFTNVAPAFTSTPVTTATIDIAYTYDITVDDADPDDTNDTLTITAPTLPAWLVFTDNGDGTATLTGTPTTAEIGDHAVSLLVEDADGASTTQDFTVTVSEEATNQPPAFTSTPVTEATVGAAYSYAVTAVDDDGDTLTITSVTLPAWLTLTDNGDGTASLSGTPAAADAGTHDVSLQVSDGTAAPVLQDFIVTVEEAAEPPPPPPPPPPAPTPQPRRDGGGGALGLWSFIALLGMFGAAIRRRRA